MGGRVRLPRQAGSFYAASERSLREQIEACFLHEFGPGRLPKVKDYGPRRVLSLISPHAGYMYSGSVASQAFYYLAEDGRPDAIVLLGPNHTGYGSGVSIMMEGVWRTPLGDVSVDAELAKEIQRFSAFLDVDEGAHLFEHSIEVQLPFLQYVYGTVPFVPICMMMQDLEVSQDIGRAIARAVKGKNVSIIASTDFSHYEPQSIAETKDGAALDAISRLDEVGLQRIVESRAISMCGYGPVSAAIVASKELGAETAVRLQYKTSGDVTGDKTRVVGYASVAIVK